MTAGVQRRAQPDGLAAELQLQPCGFGGCLPPGEKPQAQFYRRAARPRTAPTAAAAKHAGRPSNLPYPATRVPVRRMTRRTTPASAMFSAAYQQAAVTSRRLLRQPNAAAVMPSAVAALYADLHRVRLLGREQNQVPRAPPVRCPPASGQTAHAGRSAPPPPAAEGTPSGNSSAAAHRDTPPF